MHDCVTVVMLLYTKQGKMRGDADVCVSNISVHLCSDGKLGGWSVHGKICRSGIQNIAPGLLIAHFGPTHQCLEREGESND